MAFYATENLAIFADFCQNKGFWRNSISDNTIFRVLRDLIFYQHTPTYTLSKMGEKEQTKILIWPLRGASKVPQDFGICQFLPKSKFLAKFNISLHNIQGSERQVFAKNELLAKFSIRLHHIQGSERPDFLSTHTHIHPKQDGRKRTNQNFYLAPQGASKVQDFSKNKLLALFSIRLHNTQGPERPDS